MSQLNRTAGVIGGMGPDATVDFMSKVIAATSAQTDQDHAHLIVDQNPKVPSRRAAALGDGEDPGPTMAGMAQGLQNAGADFLVMPCNFAHVFAQKIRAAVTIPLVSIVDVTIAACENYGTLGLLATDGCLSTGIYQSALSAARLDAILPDKLELTELMRLITAIKAGDQSDAIGESMQAVASAMVGRGARAIIAACTEIPLVLKADMLGVPLISSTDELAEVTATICAGTRKIS